MLNKLTLFRPRGCDFLSRALCCPQFCEFWGLFYNRLTQKWLQVQYDFISGNNGFLRWNLADFADQSVHLMLSSRLFDPVISVVWSGHLGCLTTSNQCFDFKRLQKWTVSLCLFSFSSPLALYIAAPRWCTFVKITQPHPLTPSPKERGVECFAGVWHCGDCCGGGSCEFFYMLKGLFNHHFTPLSLGEGVGGEAVLGVRLCILLYAQRIV